MVQPNAWHGRRDAAQNPIRPVQTGRYNSLLADAPIQLKRRIYQRSAHSCRSVRSRRRRSTRWNTRSSLAAPRTVKSCQSLPGRSRMDGPASAGTNKDRQMVNGASSITRRPQDGNQHDHSHRASTSQQITTKPVNRTYHLWRPCRWTHGQRKNRDPPPAPRRECPRGRPTGSTHGRA